LAKWKEKAGKPNRTVSPEEGRGGRVRRPLFPAIRPQQNLLQEWKGTRCLTPENAKGNSGEALKGQGSDLRLSVHHLLRALAWNYAGGTDNKEEKREETRSQKKFQPGAWGQRGGYTTGVSSLALLSSHIAKAMDDPREDRDTDRMKEQKKISKHHKKLMWLKRQRNSRRKTLANLS